MPEQKPKPAVIKKVGPGFGAFLTREHALSCSGCSWMWQHICGKDYHVHCYTCNVSYTPTASHYLRRIYLLEEELNACPTSPTRDDLSRS